MCTGYIYGINCRGYIEEKVMNREYYRANLIEKKVDYLMDLCADDCQ